METNRKPGRPRADEDASTHRATLRVPTKTWTDIQALAESEGITTHAWMRRALYRQAQAELDADGRPR